MGLPSKLTRALATLSLLSMCQNSDSNLSTPPKLAAHSPHTPKQQPGCRPATSQRLSVRGREKKALRRLHSFRFFSQVWSIQWFPERISQKANPCPVRTHTCTQNHSHLRTHLRTHTQWKIPADELTLTETDEEGEAIWHLLGLAVFSQVHQLFSLQSSNLSFSGSSTSWPSSARRMTCISPSFWPGGITLSVAHSDAWI